MKGQRSQPVEYGPASGRRAASFGALGLLIVLLLPPRVVPAAEDAGEYPLKAAFLLNFARFVEWSGLPAADEASLALCILGRDPFGAALDLVEGKPVRSRRLVVKRIKAVADAPGCQVLFVSASERARLPEILAALGSAPVLTVSDQEDFVHAGGMIGFLTLDDRIRFDVNLAAAQRASLQLSSQLLKLARSTAP